MTVMTPEAKAKLSKTIRALRERLLADLGDALRGEYNLGITSAEQAKLSEARAKRRARLDDWAREQARAALKDKKFKGDKDRNKAVEAKVPRFRAEVVEEAAYTWLNRLVYLRLLEGMKLRPTKLLTGGLASSMYSDFRDLAQALVGHEDGDDSDGYMFVLGLVFDELALDLPGLFGRTGLSELVPMRWSTLRHVIEALDEPELESCWTDDMTLGWVYQYWNDPKREEIDAKLNAGGKVAPDEIASKTQMFTERYMVDWLLQNSIGPLWLAMCQKHEWTPKVVADGTLARLEARRVDWRAKRDAGEVELTELMPLHSDEERRWAYYVEQPIPADAPGLAPESIRDVKLIDPAVGSGHFLVVAFELLVALYREEAEHRGESWAEKEIVESVLADNLHGIDLDPRAVQIAAAALMLAAQRVCAQARPGRMNLVASKLRLGSLAADDPARVELREQVQADTGVPGHVTDALVDKLAGADHLGSLLKIGDALDEVLKDDSEELTRAKAEQGSLFGGGYSQVLLRREVVSLDEAKGSLQRRLEEFLGKHTGSADLGLRLRGEQLAAGVRFVRMLEEGTYHLVVGNPPYQGTGKIADSDYVRSQYDVAKADLYAAFLQRGLGLARAGGGCAMITMRTWMFIKQFSSFRVWLLETHGLAVLGDLSWGAFEGMRDNPVVMSVFRRESAGQRSIALAPGDPQVRVRTKEEIHRKRAAIQCQEGLTPFTPATLKIIPEWPLIYWWTDNTLRIFRDTELLGKRAKVRQGLATSSDARFVRQPVECRGRTFCLDVGLGLNVHEWVPFVNGAAGKKWIDPVSALLRWGRNGIEMKVLHEERYGSYSKRIPSEAFYLRDDGVAFSSIGSNFAARAFRCRSVFGHMGASVFPSDVAAAVCAMNSSLAQTILVALNPGVHFEVGDVNRLPNVKIPGHEKIFETIERGFTIHESHREPSVEFKQPGPSPWRHAQEWAQLAVDRPENTALPAYEEQLDPEPPTDHISYALGIALGRFSPDGEGILDPASTNLTHALPHGLLFLDGTQPADSTTDGLGHPACAQLHTAWSNHAPAIDTKRKHLRDYLRLDFFAVHRSMYENRPIHWPLSSANKTFVAWINIHRWHAGTLRYLLAEHLNPTKLRLDGEIADLRKTRDGADKKAARAAEKRLEHLTTWRDELAEFIANVSACAEQGPPPPDAKTPPRDDDAVYDPDLDDGVMINSAALWPLLTPQWKDPKKWWKQLATAEGRKDYDWSHLAGRYFKQRVDDKCKTDPSLAVAHKCFWKYHPERAYAWELRLQDEIAPDFAIDEAGSDAARAELLKAHSQTAEAILAKERARRTRKLEKASAEDQQDISPKKDNQ
ncbi:BREX-6 system adenine-specific DNA-methyltransferase PglX [Enhygromyxa salina]|uniref:site-specific DNA-methyltransferase (adenine-specific) n=1 Tax=Enhygromyxa salina TaxID=215803 RepID=A0A2S9YJ54_9BACT|nr:BREX-6 system adenine-specific DNA-methyltransferase PglX [Enhygromyxa salina]PRQ05135.1 Eco57I restriction-modification methylase [Enhygromyxa salina]